MDSVLSVGSSLASLRASMVAASQVESVLSTTPPSASEYASESAAFDALASRDPAQGQKAILQLMSHVKAECFISLLQIMDPLPDDERDRAEYKRHYRQLREVLTLPPPPPDPRPLPDPRDPLR